MGMGTVYKTQIIDTTECLMALLSRENLHRFEVIERRLDKYLAKRILEFIPELVVLDLSQIPNTAFIWKLKVLSPRTHFIVTVNDYKEAFDSIKQGAIAYVYKRDMKASLPQVLDEAIQDHSVFDNKVAASVLQYFKRDKYLKREKFLLTQIEITILYHLMENYNVSGIQDMSTLITENIPHYLGNIAMKLALSSNDINLDDVRDEFTGSEILVPWKDDGQVRDTSGRIISLFIKAKRKLSSRHPIRDLYDFSARVYKQFIPCGFPVFTMTIRGINFLTMPRWSRQ